MTWNFRVIRKTTRVKIAKHKYKVVHYYDIHEVFYNAKGKPTSWTKEPVSPSGYDNIKETQLVLCQMLKDILEYPVLEFRKKKLVERMKQ